MIEYIAPALNYILKALGVRPEYTAVAAAALLRCWSAGDCRTAEKFQDLCRGDPVCEYIKNIVKYKDLTGAKRAFSWYIKCTGRRLVKLLDVEGNIVGYDYTEEFLRKHPPPDFPCR